MTDYRDFAIELVEEMGVDPKDMLVAALKYMSQSDVEYMLRINEYPQPCEEDEEPDVDYLTELYDAFGEDC